MDTGTVPGGMAEFAKLQEKAGVGGRGRRSSLTRWMGVHHDEFAAMLADRKPSWDEVAAILAAMGLRDGQGKPPDGDRARKTWWSVQREKAGPAARCSRAPASQPLVPGEVTAGVCLVPVSRPGPVDVQPPVPLDRRPGMPAGTVATSQDRPAAESIPAPPAFVAGNTVADSARLILDGGDGDGLAHGRLPSDIVPPPSITDQVPPGVRTDLGRGPERIGAVQTEPSTDTGPAAPALNSGAAEALPDPSPIPAALAPALTPDPIIPAAQEAAVITPNGVRQSRFRLSSFWKKPA